MDASVAAETGHHADVPEKSFPFIDLDELEKFLHRQTEAVDKFLVREEKIYRQGRVDLDHDSVFRVADKGFDAQVPLDLFE